jgi:sulfur dioxygenase
MQDNFFEGYGILSHGFLSVSPKETVQLCAKGAILLDVREDYLNAFKQFAVPQVVYLPMSELGLRYKELPADGHFIVADAAGIRSKEAVQLLMNKAFSKVANLAGGMIEWERDGAPLRIDLDERLTGSCMCQLRPRDKKKK